MEFHELKTDPAAFDAVWHGRKTHEIRFNDRNFQVGDALALIETKFSGEQMRAGAPLEVTGRKLYREVTHIQEGYGLEPGWVILSITAAPTVPEVNTDRDAIALADAIDPGTRTISPGDVTLTAAAIALRDLGKLASTPRPFPECDYTRPAEQQGLFRKFEVRRTDGSDRPGGKHYGCRYFVIDITHDQHAPAALRSYAASCADTHPLLATDLNAEFGEDTSRALQAGWKAYVSVAEGSLLRPSRHVPDGTYALVDRDEWDKFAFSTE